MQSYLLMLFASAQVPYPCHVLQSELKVQSFPFVGSIVCVVCVVGFIWVVVVVGSIVCVVCVVGFIWVVVVVGSIVCVVCVVGFIWVVVVVGFCGISFGLQSPRIIENSGFLQMHFSTETSNLASSPQSTHSPVLITMKPSAHLLSIIYIGGDAAYPKQTIRKNESDIHESDLPLQNN